mgnify:CR=1 FL=1
MTEADKSLWERTKELAGDAADRAKEAAKEVLDEAKETGEKVADAAATARVKAADLIDKVADAVADPVGVAVVESEAGVAVAQEAGLTAEPRLLVVRSGVDEDVELRSLLASRPPMCHRVFAIWPGSRSAIFRC